MPTKKPVKKSAPKRDALEQRARRREQATARLITSLDRSVKELTSEVSLRIIDGYAQRDRVIAEFAAYRTRTEETLDRGTEVNNAARDALVAATVKIAAQEKQLEDLNEEANQMLLRHEKSDKTLRAELKMYEDVITAAVATLGLPEDAVLDKDVVVAKIIELRRAVPGTEARVILAVEAWLEDLSEHTLAERFMKKWAPATPPVAPLPWTESYGMVRDANCHAVVCVDHDNNAGSVAAYLVAAANACETLEWERDELVEATILGPLAGKTMHDALVELRAREAELLAAADADALMLTQVGRERDSARTALANAESAARYQADLAASYVADRDSARADVERLTAQIATSRLHGGCHEDLLAEAARAAAAECEVERLRGLLTPAVRALESGDMIARRGVAAHIRREGGLSDE